MKKSLLMITALNVLIILSACGKKGGDNAVGGLAGLDGEGKCIPSTLAPFGRNFSALSAGQRQQVYALLRKIDELNRLGTAAELVAYRPPNFTAVTPYSQLLVDEVSAGKCSGGIVGGVHAGTFSLDGAGCAVSYKEDIAVPRVLKDGTMFETESRSFKVNDLSIEGVSTVVGFSRSQSGLLSTNKGIVRCSQGEGAVQTTDQGEIKTYFAQELFSPDEANHTRRGFKFPGFAVEVQYIGHGDTEDITINGVPAVHDELNAAGIDGHTFEEDKNEVLD